MSTTRVALRSKADPNKFLRMDGEGVTHATDNGGGKINTSDFIGSYETLDLVRFDDGTVSFRSTVFNNVYLRMDGRSVNPGQLYPPGAGIMNCQFGSGPWEKYSIVRKEHLPEPYRGIVGIESNAFPGRFVRIDGPKNVVNVQGVFKDLEEWEILVIG